MDNDFAYVVKNTKYTELQLQPKISGISRKTPEFRKMATMISWFLGLN